MKITDAQRHAMRKYGFMWFKDKTTDKVSDDCIQDVIPSANGFTVIYNENSVIEMSTCVCSEIFMPDDVTRQWIRVTWDTIVDQRRD